MRSALRGDALSYRLLLAEMAPVLRASAKAALRRAGRPDRDAEDIVQETLLAVHLKKQTWNPTLPLQPWLNAILRYKTIDALRREKITFDIADFPELAATPESAEPRSDALRLMERLGARASAIVEAISIEGRSPREVGAQWNMSEGAVRVALHRALKDLARLYRTSKI